MSSIHEQTVIHCPSSQAEEHLKAFFIEHQKKNTDIAIVPLRVLPAFLNEFPALEVERDIEFSIRPASNRFGSYRAIFDVEWRVEIDGPLPKFCGSFSIRDAEEFDKFTLTLDGSYVAPFSASGQFFDTLLGHIISDSTISELMNRIRSFVEARYNRFEEASRSLRLQNQLYASSSLI